MGTRGGIWVFWKYGIDLVLFYERSPNYFHALFHFDTTDREFLMTGIHAPSTSRDCHLHWKDMQADVPPAATPWLMLGDLNEVTSQSEKQRGHSFNPTQCLDLHNFMDKAR